MYLSVLYSLYQQLKITGEVSDLFQSKTEKLRNKQRFIKSQYPQTGQDDFLVSCYSPFIIFGMACVSHKILHGVSSDVNSLNFCVVRTYIIVVVVVMIVGLL